MLAISVFNGPTSGKHVFMSRASLVVVEDRIRYGIYVIGICFLRSVEFCSRYNKSSAESHIIDGLALV